MSQADAALVQQILADVKSGKLQLPSPPEFAHELHEAIEDDRRDISYIARIIQYDPGLTSRIIQVANSVLYIGKQPVTSCREAITRIGIITTRQLVFSFTLNNAFTAKSAMIRRQMDKSWEMGREIAVLTYIIADKTPRMDPHRALMAGLIHNVGTLPILQYVDSYPEIIAAPRRLAYIIDKLNGTLGTFILRRWKFDDEIAAIPTEIRDWMRDPANTPDYADLVNVARSYYAIGHPQPDKRPKLFELPAFNKLSLHELGPEGCIETLKEAELEMGVVKALL